MNTKSSHDRSGYAKVPSRRGGLKRVVCTCGWQSQPANAESRERLFMDHVAEAGAAKGGQ